MALQRATRILPQDCTFAAEIFERETTLRKRLQSITEPNVLSGISIATAELAKLRRDHSNGCVKCAASEDARLRSAA